MKRYLAYGLTCVLMMVAGAAVNATTIVVPSDEALIAKSPVILTGTVEASTAADFNGKIWTETTVVVGNVLKGNAPQRITVRELGGELDDRFTIIYGRPEFARGERVLLFLEPNPHGGYRTIDMFMGKFSEAHVLDGRLLWLRDDANANVTLLDADFEEIHVRNVQRDGAKFETFVNERIAGRAGEKNYSVENPVLAPKKTSGSTGVSEQFTLLSPGRVYRWGRFDSNQTANWYSVGQQTGYTDGGLTETRTAMNAWANYSSAKILYGYAGTRSTATGGVNGSNGYNEVFFNDPLNEISGSYNRTTGGVVGLGGYSGVSGGGNWTAPFTADASHPAGTVYAYNISEGNLAIQDGVSAANGISSSRLAEIIAHEFGHTLGFGHSSDSTALMYATVVGLGPSLRADDQLAARWLYPNGGGGGPTPTAPSAPSGLTATPSGTTNVALSWTDNANNETGQSIYYAVGNGSFTKVGDVGVNVQSTTLTGFTAGTYRFYVIAFNGAGNSAQSNIAQATIAAAPTLTARFSYTPQSGTAGSTTFTFYDESTGGVTSRVWNFGDGTTSTASVANKVWANPGAYTVTLTVSAGGSSAQTQTIVNVNAPLNANFNWSPANPTTNDTITFGDQSTGGVTAWSWNFGDGTTSSLANPTKRYTVPGIYPVTLTVGRNGEGHATTKSVTVVAPAPITPPIGAAFDASATSVVAGTSVSFTDRSTGSPTAWSWSFGDGTFSSAKNPVHAWAAPGTYTVTLIASNTATSGTTSKTITVTSIEPYRSLISAAAHTNGLGGTAWRTELILFNAGTQGANVTALFIPGAGGSVITRSLFLSPKQSATYANTLVDLFGVSNGAGAVAVEATSAGAAAQLRITSRTFTGAATGTYGLSVPDVQSDALQQTLYLTAIQSNDKFRTNVGLVNRGGSDMPATLTLYNRDGGTVATANVTVPANNFQQLPLAQLFPAADGRQFDVLSMRVQAASQNALTAYASVVDNDTQDPMYTQAMPALSGSSLTIPIVGRAQGANNTFWRSDVTIFNPSSNRVTYSLRYNGTAKSLSLDARETFVLSDIVTTMGFSSGVGTLGLTWSGSAAPVVTSRNYTTRDNGSFGQSIDPVRAFGNDLYIAGLRMDTDYRSNIGFVNGGDENESFTVTLYSQWGTQIASTTMSLGPNEVFQQLVTVMFPGTTLAGNFTVHVRGDGNAKLFAYGSMIDNASGDPVFFAGR